jgi:hypothetical protein
MMPQIKQTIFDKLYHSTSKFLVSEIVGKVNIEAKIFVGTIPTIKDGDMHPKVVSLNNRIESFAWNSISNSDVQNIAIDTDGDFYNLTGSIPEEKWPYNKDEKLMKDSGYIKIAESFKNALESEY